MIWFCVIQFLLLLLLLCALSHAPTITLVLCATAQANVSLSLDVYNGQFLLWVFGQICVFANALNRFIFILLGTAEAVVIVWVMAVATAGGKSENDFVVFILDCLWCCNAVFSVLLLPTQSAHTHTILYDRNKLDEFIYANLNEMYACKITYQSELREHICSLSSSCVWVVRIIIKKGVLSFFLLGIVVVTVCGRSCSL